MGELVIWTSEVAGPSAVVLISPPTVAAELGGDLLDEWRAAASGS